MYLEVFKYLDRIMNIVRPRKLLYIAIDGVAPRAKMNQQRSRRFRSAFEERLCKEESERLRAEMAEGGMNVPPRKPSWDSNVITPGTLFMDNLTKYLQYYIYDKMNHQPGWKNLVVILSDANVPGEVKQCKFSL